MGERKGGSEEPPDTSINDFDDILVLIGEFGTYQKLLFVFLTIASMLQSMGYAAVVFIELTPSFRCKLPSLPNDTFKSEGEWHKHIVDVSLMNVTDGKCTVPQNTSPFGDAFQNETKPEKCTEWVFDTTDVTYSYPMQFSLVCDHSSKLTNSYITNVLGTLVGGPLYGVIADVAGRKVALLLGLFLSGVSGIAWAFSPTYDWSVAFRFLYGLGISALYGLSSTLALEMVGPNRRMGVGTGLAFAYSAGATATVGIAYFLRDWRHLQLAMSAPCLLSAVIMFWCLPESPRWLLTRGRHKLAHKILKRTARINGTLLPEDLIGKVEINEPPTASARALLRAPKLMLKMLLLYVNWFVADMTYFGLNLHAGNMAGDIYFNFLLLTLIEYPANAVCFTIDRFGRKKPFILFIIAGALACLAPLLVQEYADKDLESTHYIKIALFAIGKFGMTAAYNVLYIWSIEVFPTVTRNFSMGLGSVSAALGNMLCPVIVRDIKVEAIGKDTLPLVIFGAAAIFGSVCTIPLPETAKRDLPETIEDANTFKHRRPLTDRKDDHAHPDKVVIAVISETTRL
ncbi:organic cation transporter protein [Lingula anatina]|uniref:Organic cation transporter protein n=1 Tax=Lingula anatina TaxID=7574 RepID=A0A1S3HE37_LINAN|nr:organic cation transporter protein [Lingula anatina]|eukprot:XP_013384270.1 organic cation transporter protein [Lingula anatina]